jgi:hypothetical protein
MRARDCECCHPALFHCITSPLFLWGKLGLHFKNVIILILFYCHFLENDESLKLHNMRCVCIICYQSYKVPYKIGKLIVQKGMLQARWCCMFFVSRGCLWPSSELVNHFTCCRICLFLVVCFYCMHWPPEVWEAVFYFVSAPSHVAQVIFRMARCQGTWIAVTLVDVFRLRL